MSQDNNANMAAAGTTGTNNSNGIAAVSVPAAGTTTTSDSIPVLKMFGLGSYPKEIGGLGQLDANAIIEQAIPATRNNDEMDAVKLNVAYPANTSLQATAGSSTIYHDLTSTSS